MTTVSEITDTLAGYERVARVCSDGHVIVSWERAVPRISEEVLDVALYLYPSEKAANKGMRAGGSGFLVHIPASPDVPEKAIFTYAVTNKHVVKDSPVIRLNGKDGHFKMFSLTPRSWFTHRSDDDLDLAVYSLSLDPDIYEYRSIGHQLFLGANYGRPVDAFDIGVGDDVYMVGRSITLEGTQRNTPTVRCGTIAMMPTEKIDGSEYYLIETHSMPGYSGSPVMVVFPVNRMHPRYANEPPTTRVQFLLGISTSMSKTYDPTYKKGIKGEGYKKSYDLFVQTNTGLTAVIPCSRLDDLLYQPELREMRQREEAEMKRQKGKDGPTLEPTSATASTQHTKPKKGKPIEIPIPTRDEVMDVFKRATRKWEKK